MKLGTKLLAGFFAVTLILLAVGLFGIHNAAQSRRFLSTSEYKSFPKIKILHAINAQALRINMLLTAVVSYGELTPKGQQGINDLRQRWNTSWKDIDQSLEHFATLDLIEPEEIATRKKTKESIEESRALLEKNWQYTDTLATTSDQFTYKTAYANYQSLLGESRKIIRKVGAEAKDNFYATFKVIEQKVHNSNATARRAIVLYITAIAIGVSTALLLGIALTRSTLRQLGGEPAYASNIVKRLAKGDFTGKIALKSGDRTSLLAAMSSMSGDIRNVLREISSAGSQVAAASTELSANVEEASQGLNAQQSEIDQVATAMNEMSSTVEEVARNASAAAQAASQADSEASAGGDVIKQSIASINQLASEIRAASEVIGQLSANSQEIGDVLDVIRSVADQTNLLALNAAIEAARAGEQGRGFAVVADEVRTLASRTQASIQDIQGKIERVQSGSANAVQVMEQSQTMAGTVVDQAEQAGGALDRIGNAITSITDMNRQIASAAEEQNAVAEEINRNIQSIAGAANQILAGSDQASTASNELARLAESMAHKLSHFKV